MHTLTKIRLPLLHLYRVPQLHCIDAVAAAVNMHAIKAESLCLANCIYNYVAAFGSNSYALYARYAH